MQAEKVVLHASMLNLIAKLSLEACLSLTVVYRLLVSEVKVDFILQY